MGIVICSGIYIFIGVSALSSILPGTRARLPQFGSDRDFLNVRVMVEDENKTWLAKPGFCPEEPGLNLPVMAGRFHPDRTDYTCCARNSLKKIKISPVAQRLSSKAEEGPNQNRHAFSVTICDNRRPSVGKLSHDDS